MSRIKNLRICALVMSFVLVISCFLVPNVFAEESLTVNEKTDEVLFERCNKEYTLLSKLGIINRDFKAEDEITRGEFAAIVARFTEAHKSGLPAFEDVNEDTPNAVAIGAVTKSGVMSGYANENKFYPENPITQLQAISVLLRAVGYEKIALYDGGYPKGYLKHARDNKMLADCGLEDNLTWEFATKLVYNTLFAKVPEYYRINSNGHEYSISETEVIERVFGLYKAKGTIVSDCYVGLGDRKKCVKGFILVEDEKTSHLLNDASNSAIDKVGDKIVYYYDSENNLFTYIDDYRSDKSVVEITEENFGSVNRTLTEIVYYKKDSNKPFEAKISKFADMVYNGVEYYGVTENDFYNADLIKLVDADNDGIYDIVYIEEYEIRLVDKIVVETKMISDKRAGVIPIILNDPSYELSVVIDGEEVDFSLISEWDTVCIAKSKNSKDNRVRIIVCSDLVVGVVESKKDAKRTVTVDGATFYVSKKLGDMKDIQPKREIIMGLNPQGSVVCFDYTEVKGKQYGYALGFSYENKMGVENAKLRLIDAEGNYSILELDEKIHLNGKRDDISKVAGVLDLSGSKITHQLIGYELNATGKIKKIFTADKNNPQGAVEPKNAENPEELICNAYLNRKYAMVGGYLNAQYLYTSDTACFIIITDEHGNVVEELSGKFTGGEEAYYDGRAQNVYVYDSGEECVAGAIVVTFPVDEAATYLPYEDYAFVVDEVQECVDPMGNITKAVTGFHESAYATYYVEENVDVSNWKRGDTFMIGMSRNRKIIYARKMFGLYDDSDYVLSRTNYENGEYTTNKTAMRVFSTDEGGASATTAYLQSRLGVYGVLKGLSSAGNFNILRVHARGCADNDYNVFTYEKGSPVYIWNTERDTITLVDTSNLARGLEYEVNLFTYNGQLRHIMIIQ